MNLIWVKLNLPSFTARMVQIVVSGDWKVGMEKQSGSVREATGCG